MRLLRTRDATYLTLFEHWKKIFAVVFGMGVVSGIVIAIFGIPQALAYAALVGLDPGMGLYSVIVPALVYPLMGWSRVGAIGPMSVPCLYMGAVADSLLIPANSNERWALVAGMAFWSGCFCCLLGLFRMAELVDFMSEPVLKGFAAASGLLVAIHTLDELLGVTLHKMEKDSSSPFQIQYLVAELGELFGAVPRAVGVVVVTSLLMVLFYVGCKCVDKKVGAMVKQDAKITAALANTDSIHHTHHPPIAISRQPPHRCKLLLEGPCGWFGI